MKIIPSEFMRTKSGTKVYLVDSRVSIVERKRALSAFIQTYNKSFTIEEQKKIGNIIYRYNKQGKNWERMGISKKGSSETELYAGHGEINLRSSNNELNSGKKTMPWVGFSKKSCNDEMAVVHELIHCKDDSNNKNIANTLKNEHRTDFEMVGRLSKKGFNQYVGEAKRAVEKDDKGIKRKPVSAPSGYYSDVKHVRKLPDKKQLKAIVTGITNDRKLLTGSLNTNVTGKIASSKAKSLFGKSFFNKK